MSLKVGILEPFCPCKGWVNDLAHVVAFLELLNLDHGDLQPENYLSSPQTT